MLRLKLDGLLYEKRMNPNQLSEKTGIRYPTVLDMVKNKSKHWSPDNLAKIMEVLGITNVSELIEYTEESPGS